MGLKPLELLNIFIRQLKLTAMDRGSGEYNEQWITKAEYSLFPA